MAKLTNEELESLVDLIKRFQKLGNELDLCGARLNEIEKERESLNKRVEDLNEKAKLIRKEETDLTDSLINKYGPFKLDMETFEIITS